MLRLDPAYPPVWRTPTTLQFGVDAVALLEDPEPWEERVVHELSRGLLEGAVHPLAAEAGATAADIRRLLERLAPALRATEAASARAVLIHRPATIDEEDARAVRDAVMADGARVRLMEGDDLRPLEGETVILLAAHVVDPRLAAALLRDDVPHLPLVFTGRRATIGPLVRPGETACLMCVEARRRDLDPAWPAIASQLLALRARSVGRALALKSAPLRISTVVRFTPVACAMVRAGAGVAVVDEFVLRGRTWPELVSRPLAPKARVRAHLLTPRFEPLSRTAGAFVEILKGMVPALPKAAETGESA